MTLLLSTADLDTFEILPGLEVITRTAWGADGPYKTRTRVGPPTAYSYLEIHHGASNNANADNDPAAVMRYYQRLHRDNGWSDIFYCLGLDPYGVLWDGRSFYRSHKSPQWGEAFTIVLLGNYDLREPTASQLATIQRFWKAMSQ